MSLYQVCDLSIDEIREKTYDYAFFSCGYEKRCTFVPNLIEKTNVKNCVILFFKENSDDEQRILNNQFFTEKWDDSYIDISSEDEGPLYQFMSSIDTDGLGPLHILIDYSSMSRLWYSGLLNWARFYQGQRDIFIDFVYSVGIHKEKVHPVVIKDILSIPGCEGGPVPLFKAIAVFGLGFDGLSPLCVLDRIEPDEFYVYLASPAAFEDYPSIVYKQNKELIQHSKAVLELPLGSVEKSFKFLSEIVSTHRSEGDITFIPMGPKPHVLAAILLAIKFEEVACLRVSTKNRYFDRTDTDGTVVATRVYFKQSHQL